jgi:hypothetical protein
MTEMAMSQGFEIRRVPLGLGSAMPLPFPASHPSPQSPADGEAP